MHNLDRTQLEFAGEYGENEQDAEVYGETMHGGGYPGELGELGGFAGEQYEYPGEVYGETYGEFGFPGETELIHGENEAFHSEVWGELPGEGMFPGETGAAYETFPHQMSHEQSFEAVFSEQHEIALASELLEISTESELQHFLGKLARGVMRGVRKFVRLPVIRGVLNGLKTVARVALPKLGAIAGNFLLPGVGGVIGSKLGSLAGSAMGLEAEGLSPEDREFLTARRFIQLSGEAFRQAAAQGNALPPDQAAQRAIMSAAEITAPEISHEIGRMLFRNQSWSSTGLVPAHSMGMSGRWVRRGRRIVLFGV